MLLGRERIYMLQAWDHNAACNCVHSGVKPKIHEGRLLHSASPHFMGEPATGCNQEWVCNWRRLSRRGCCSRRCRA